MFLINSKRNEIYNLNMYGKVFLSGKSIILHGQSAPGLNQYYSAKTDNEILHFGSMLHADRAYKNIMSAMASGCHCVVVTNCILPYVRKNNLNESRYE